MRTEDEELNKNRGSMYPIHLDESARSVFDLSPVAVRRAVMDVQPELFHKDDRELESDFKPTRTDRKIKLSFWKEYDLAVSEMRSMKTENICRNVCHPNYFRDHFLKNEGKVVWLLVPPNDYMMELETMMGTAADRLNEIMNIPITKKDKNGNDVVDVNAAGLVLKAIKQLEDRVKGAPIQKQENKNLSINYDAGSEKAHIDVDKKIAELEDAIKNTRIAIPDTIDAEVIDVQDGEI